MTLNLRLERLLVAVYKLFSKKVLAEQECSEKKEDTLIYCMCIWDLSRLTRVEKAVKKHNYYCNIQGVSVYTNVSANYMFWPLLVKPSSGWIP